MGLYKVWKTEHAIYTQCVEADDIEDAYDVAEEDGDWVQHTVDFEWDTEEIG